MTWEPLKGLSFSGKVGYNYSNYYNKRYASTLVFDENKTFSPNSLNVSNGNTTLTTLQFLSRYSKSIKEHHFDILLGVSQEEYKQNWGDGYRKDFPNDLKQWLKVKVSTLFEFREEIVSGITISKTKHVDSILQRYRIRN